MLCICMPQVAEMVAGIEAAEMSVEVPALPEGVPGLAAAAGAAAAMDATAELAASGALEAMLNAELPPFSLEDVLALEAMAQVDGALGIPLTAPTAAMDLSLAAGALNIAAPALGEMSAGLGAALEPLSGLPIPLSIAMAIEMSLGIDMGAPGAAAALEASFAASLEASADLSVSASLAAELGLAARALNAAIALGFDPAAPEEFALALEATAALEIPPLALTGEEMGEMSAGLGDLGLINALLAGLPEGGSIEATMAAMVAEMGIAAEATASMAAELSASGSAELAAALTAAGPAPLEAAIALGGLDLSGLPSMGELPLAASLAASFEAATGAPMLSGVPCPNIFCVAGR